jgi:positive phototaxis protein PixI
MTQATSTHQPYLNFQITPDHLGMLPTEQLVEVITIHHPQIIPIPQMPPHVLGVYNWRGEVIWIIDSALILGPTPTTTIKHAILLRHQTQVIGLIVQHINQMLWCNPSDIQAPPSPTTDQPIDHLSRWLSPQQQPIYLLTSNNLLPQ